MTQGSQELEQRVAGCPKPQKIGFSEKTVRESRVANITGSVLHCRRIRLSDLQNEENGLKKGDYPSSRTDRDSGFLVVRRVSYPWRTSLITSLCLRGGPVTRTVLRLRIGSHHADQETEISSRVSKS